MKHIRSLFVCLWLTVGQIPVCQGAPQARQNASSVTSTPDGSSITSKPSATTGPDFEPTETVKVSTTTASNGTIQILPSLSDLTPHTTGTVNTGIDGTDDRGARKAPFATSSIELPTSLLDSVTSLDSSPRAFETKMASSDIFADPIATSALPDRIQVRDDHPVPRKGITSGFPLQTNKFFSNFFLGDQTAPTYTFPYTVSWAAGRDPSGSYGIAVSHIDAEQRVFGDAKPETGAASYFINPVGIQSLIVSAKELDEGANLTTDGITAFSATVQLRKDPDSSPLVTFPLVQGMGFVTSMYNGATPVIQTSVFFRTVTRVSEDPKSDVAKYRFVLEDGKTWWLYAYKLEGEDLDLQVTNNGRAESRNPFHGVIQIAKDVPGAEPMLDQASGVYAETTNLSGSASGSSGRYSFDFTPRGHPEGALLMWALPHHVESFDHETAAFAQDVHMTTTTKGLARAVLGTRWTMVESEMPVNMGFAPYSPEGGSMSELSEAAQEVIRVVANNEISQNIIEQSNLDSMYFSGKVRRSTIWCSCGKGGELTVLDTGARQVCDDFVRH